MLSFVKPPFHIHELAEVNDYRVANPKSSNGYLSAADGGGNEASWGRAAGLAGRLTAVTVVPVVPRRMSYPAWEARESPSRERRTALREAAGWETA